MKILMSAYACEPDAGSEPGTGWAWATATATEHDVWLLTRRNNEPKLREALLDHPRIRAVYLDLPPWARWWKRGRRGIHLYYVLWQLIAFRAAKRLHAEERFDVSHHITLAIDWLPAGIAWVRDLPCIWGPVGGSCPPPWFAWRWLGWRGAFEEVARELTSRPLRRVFGDPTARRAALVVAQNREGARRFDYTGRVLVEPHVALGPEMLQRLATPAQRHGDRRPTAVFVGRLLSWKGVHLAVETIAQDQAREWTLKFVGDGPERGRLLRRAERLGIADRVSFTGPVPRDAVIDLLRSADAFLFPSMHDSAPWAVAEALAAGIPVVCLDRAGPARLVNGQNATAVPCSGEAPGRLATALQTSERAGPDAIWAATRIPGVASSFYEAARANVAVVRDARS